MANEYLTAAHLVKIATDIGNAVKGLGAGASVQVTYSRITASVYSPTAGSMTETKTDSTPTAYRYDFKSLQKDGTERAMVGFMIAVADLSTEPTRKDRITSNSLIYDVELWGKDPTGGYWDIICPKAAT